MAGLLACFDRGAIQVIEHMRKFAQSRGQRVAFGHPRTHPHDDALGAASLDLLGHGLEGFFQRQAGFQQGRQLTCDQGQLSTGNTPGQIEATAAAAA